MTSPAAPSPAATGSALSFLIDPGPKSLSFPDGSPALWPTRTNDPAQSNPDEMVSFYGLLDGQARPVAPATYARLVFCHDADGHQTYVLAFGTRLDVWAADGTLVGQLPPVADVACALDGTAAILYTVRVPPTDALVPTIGELTVPLPKQGDPGWSMQLLDLASLSPLLPDKPGQAILPLDAKTVDVWEAGSATQYLFTPSTGQRVPHPGYAGVIDDSVDPAAPVMVLMPGRNMPEGTQCWVEAYLSWDCPRQWLDRTGRLFGGVFKGVGGGESYGNFHAGIAVHYVTGDGPEVFVDTSLAQVGPDYQSIAPLTLGYSGPLLGYLVDTGQSTQVLGPDLAPLGPGDATGVTCDEYGGATCTFWLPDGSSTVVGLSALVTTDVPVVINNPDDPRGVTVQAGGRSVRVDWASFLTLDLGGPPSPYVWVVQGRWQGYVDAEGRWRYRESVYQVFE